MRVINLKFDATESEVIVGNQILLPMLDDLLKKNRVLSCAVMIGKSFSRIHPELLLSIENRLRPYGVKVFLVPDSEKDKTLQTVSKIYSQIYPFAQRKTWVVAIGGGVIGDMVGFASATMLRGLPFVVVPTTLLAQVDASVGGKNGVNFRRSKNAIGAFKQPIATLLDTHFLQTLGVRDLKSGMAEMLKHGLLGSAKHWKELVGLDLNKLDQVSAYNWEELIEHSVAIKAKIVQADEKELGERALLNLGHSLAHFIEAKTKYKLYLHGECVLVGLDFALFASWKKGFLKTAEWHEAHSHLVLFGFTILGLKISGKEFVQKLALDKKMEGQGIKFIFLKSIGQAFIQENTSLKELYSLLTSYRKLQSSLLPLP